MEPLDLNKWYDPAKDDFYLTKGEPKCHPFGWYHFMHLNFWTNMQTKTGKFGWFASFHLFWYIRFYLCNTKIDGTRTFMYWAGQLGGDLDKIDMDCYVANASQPVPWYVPFRPEHWAFRLSKDKPDCEVWSNMGGL